MITAVRLNDESGRDDALSRHWRTSAATSGVPRKTTFFLVIVVVVGEMGEAEVVCADDDGRLDQERDWFVRWVLMNPLNDLRLMNCV